MTQFETRQSVESLRAMNVCTARKDVLVLRPRRIIELEGAADIVYSNV